MKTTLRYTVLFLVGGLLPKSQTINLRSSIQFLYFVLGGTLVERTNRSFKWLTHPSENACRGRVTFFRWWTLHDSSAVSYAKKSSSFNLLGATGRFSELNAEAHRSIFLRKRSESSHRMNGAVL